MSTLKRLAMLISAILLCVLCVSCDLDYKASASVSFVTSVSKAINQSGTSKDYSTDVSNYYWTYYAGKTAPTDESEFLLFENKKASDNSYNKGIGEITDLYMGQSYYFALKAFVAYNNNSGAAEELRWFGCSELTTVASSTTPVRINLEAAGNGSCRFVLSAPADVDNATAYRFQIQLAAMNGTEIQVINSDDIQADNGLASLVSDEYSLACGCYRATIKQQYTADGIEYKDINNRKQITLVQVNSGVITTVKGTLDSTKEAN